MGLIKLLEKVLSHTLRVLYVVLEKKRLRVEMIADHKYLWKEYDFDK